MPAATTSPPPPERSAEVGSWWARQVARWRSGPSPGEVPRPGVSDTPGGGEADRLLRQLEWTALRRLDGLLQGDYRTLLRGLGLDLADLREYQPGDDVRHIDWNVTARLQTPHVRRFQESRDMTAWLMVDTSASMQFGSTGQDKAQQALAVCALLARLLTAHGNRVGALIFGAPTPEGAASSDRPVAVVPPAASRRHVLHLVDQVLQHQRRAERPRPDAPGTGWRLPRWRGRGAPPRADGADGSRLGAWLEAAGPLLKRRATVLIVSDFVAPPGWESALGRLAQRHEVLAIRLVDPLDQALPDLGLVTLQDLESGEHLLVDAGDPSFRQRYAQLSAAAQERLRQALAQAGVDTLELSTDEALPDALARLCTLRRLRQRRAGGRSPGGPPPDARSPVP